MAKKRAIGHKEKFFHSLEENGVKGNVNLHESSLTNPDGSFLKFETYPKIGEKVGTFTRTLSFPNGDIQKGKFTLAGSEKKNLHQVLLETPPNLSKGTK